MEFAPRLDDANDAGGRNSQERDADHFARAALDDFFLRLPIDLVRGLENHRKTMGK